MSSIMFTDGTSIHVTNTWLRSGTQADVYTINNVVLTYQDDMYNYHPCFTGGKTDLDGNYWYFSSGGRVLNISSAKSGDVYTANVQNQPWGALYISYVPSDNDYGASEGFYVCRDIFNWVYVSHPSITILDAYFHDGICTEALTGTIPELTFSNFITARDSREEYIYNNYDATRGKNLITTQSQAGMPYGVQYFNYGVQVNYPNVIDVASAGITKLYDISFAKSLVDDEPIPPEPELDPDPYNPGGTTEPTVGPTSGTWSLPEDELAVGPSFYNDLSSGLYRAYCMSNAQVTSLGAQLWSSNVLTQLATHLMHPTDVVLSLIAYPFRVTEWSGTEEIQFNWINNWLSSSVYGNPLTSEVQHLSFGKIVVPRYSGIFYDFQPYSSAQLHLPYIGYVPLKMNEIIGKEIYIDYYVLLTTGDFTAHITVNGNPQVLGLYQGQIGRPLPLAHDDFMNVVMKGVETGALAVSTAIIGAETAQQYNYVRQVEMTADKLASNGFEQTADAMRSHLKNDTNAYRDLAVGGAMVRRNVSDVGASSMQTIAGTNGIIQRNGTITGINGRTSHQQAFLMMSVPHQNIPTNQKILGYPTNLAGPLSGYSGYTEVRDIRLSVPKATSTELAEIEQIVRGGIII